MLPLGRPPAYRYRITEASFDGDRELYEKYTRGDYGACSVLLDPEGLHIVNYLTVGDSLYTPEGPVHTQPLSEAGLEELLRFLQDSPLWRQTNLLFHNLSFESFAPFASEGYPPWSCMEFHGCVLPEDWSPISRGVETLRELQVHQCTPLTCDSLDFLRNAKELFVLDLTFSGERKVDLSALEGKKGLTFLRLHHTEVTVEELRIISSLDKLETLELTDAGLTDLRPLATLHRLNWLNLEDNRITDLTPLSGLSRLEVLSLMSNEIRDVSPLAGLSGLKTLNLGNNHISDFTPLEVLNADIIEREWQR